MKRLIKKSNKEWIAYHTMPLKYLNDVLQSGKRPTGQFNNYVYLAANEDVSSAYASEPRGENVILTIKLTEDNLYEIKQNNEAFDFNDFALNYIDNNLDLDGQELYDYYEALFIIEEEYGSDFAKKIEDDVFEAYFKEAELMISEIRPEQVINHEII